VAIDRTSKFVFVQLVRHANRGTASAFLVALIAAVPYKIHTVLTDNGIQFTFPPRYADGPTATYLTHMFDMRCQENGIEHRLTKIQHPWTNGQVERMNRTIKDATVKRYHYESHRQLDAHLHDFINAYHYGRRLKTLKGLTPFAYIGKIWTQEPERFISNPIHQMLGLNIYSSFELSSFSGETPSRFRGRLQSDDSRTIAVTFAQSGAVTLIESEELICYLIDLVFPISQPDIAIMILFATNIDEGF
jgi:hypothetical protein